MVAQLESMVYIIKILLFFLLQIQHVLMVMNFWFLLSMDMINTHIIMSLCLGVLLLKDLPCSYVPIVSYLCTIFVSMLRWFPFDVRQVLTYFSDIMPDKILSELPLIETSNMQ